MKKIGILLMFLLLQSAACSQNSEKLMKNVLADYAFKTHYITIDNLEIAYVKEGRGRTTLLFLHGLSSNSDAWSKNIKTLRKNYTCVAIDLPGYGKSSKVDAAYTPTFFAEVTRKVIQKLRLKNIVLVGHSMGGQAAIKFSVVYPEQIEKLILVAPAGLESFSEAHATVLKSAYTKDMVKNTSAEQIEKNYQLNFFKMPEDASTMIADRKQIRYSSDFGPHCEAIIKSIAGMLDDPVYNVLDKIPHQTLVIFGKEDQLIPNRYFHPGLTTEHIGQIARDRIANAQLKFIEESGHFVQFEKPEAVNTYIKQFVATE